MNLVYVYLGKTIPKYVLSNVSSSALQFPDRDFYLITSPGTRYPEISLPNVFSLHYSSELFDLSVSKVEIKHNVNFRDGFWVKTLERFFALQAFSNFLEAPFIHIECDVILFDNFPFDRFRELSGEIAFPVLAKDLGIASVLWFMNGAALSNFLTFIEKYNFAVNDMEILGAYLAEFPNRVSVLPTASVHMVFEKYSDFARDVLQRNYPIFGGYFDGATLGQFIYGLDARNSFGLRRIGFNHRNHPINPEILNLSFRSGNLVLLREEPSSVFNLHIHSKDIKAFDYRERSSYLTRVTKFGMVKTQTIFSLGDAKFHLTDIFVRILRKISASMVLLRLRG